MHGHGPSNEMQDQGKAVLASNMATRGFICTEHYFKTEHFSFISGCVVRMSKRLEEVWFFVWQ